MKPKQNVQREINRTPDAFLRKRQLQIWKEKSVVNIHLKKLEVPKNILNATTKGYN